MPVRPVSSLLPEPAPPVLESQIALAQGSRDIAELAQWRYRLRYRAEHLPQDEVTLIVSFNTPPPDAVDVAAAAPPRADYGYRVRLEYGDDGEQLRALRLVRERNGSAPAGPWPDVECSTASDTAVDLGHGEGDDTVRIYAFDPPGTAPHWPGIGLTWNALDAAGMQNARASLTVVRNGNADDPPSAAYRHRSTTTEAASAVATLNRWTQDVAIGELGGSLEAALDALFVRLFGGRRVGQRVTVQLSYGYQLAHAAALTTYLPVAVFPFGAITLATASELATAAAAWKDAYRPPSDGGEWLVALVQFSQLDANAPRPTSTTCVVYRRRRACWAVPRSAA